MNTIHLTIGKWAGLLCATLHTGELSDHPGIASIAITRTTGVHDALLWTVDPKRATCPTCLVAWDVVQNSRVKFDRYHWVPITESGDAECIGSKPFTRGKVRSKSVRIINARSLCMRLDAGELAPFPFGFDGQPLKPNCTLTEQASQARLDE